MMMLLERRLDGPSPQEVQICVYVYTFLCMYSYLFLHVFMSTCKVVYILSLVFIMMMLLERQLGGPLPQEVHGYVYAYECICS
jgi:hypothetical protein